MLFELAADRPSHSTDFLNGGKQPSETTQGSRAGLEASEDAYA